MGRIRGIAEEGFRSRCQEGATRQSELTQCVLWSRQGSETTRTKTAGGDPPGTTASGGVRTGPRMPTSTTVGPAPEEGTDGAVGRTVTQHHCVDLQ